MNLTFSAMQPKFGLMDTPTKPAIREKLEGYIARNLDYALESSGDNIETDYYGATPEDIHSAAVINVAAQLIGNDPNVATHLLTHG